MRQSLTPEEFRGKIIPLRERFPDVLATSLRKPTATLGIGALTHDSSAALVDDTSGKVLFAIAEERLSNVKHDSHFPFGAIVRCCEAAREAGLAISGAAVNFRAEQFVSHALRNQLRRSFSHSESEVLSEVASGLLAIAEAPLSGAVDCPTRIHFDRMLLQSPAADWLSEPRRRELDLRMSWYFNCAYKYKVIGRLIGSLLDGVDVAFVNHHDAHAASAYFGMGSASAAILVVDGHGESDTTTMFAARGAKMTSLARTPWPHSLGSLYLAATRHLGFEYGDEYKVMGMAAYGTPRFLSSLEGLVSVGDDGVLRMGETSLMKLGDVRGSGHLRFHFTDEVEALVPARRTGESLGQAHFDFAASIQKITEATGVRLAARAVELAGERKLALAGGVGLNGLMNAAIRRSGVCDDLFVYPAAGDDGTSIGAAQAILLSKGVVPRERLRSCYFGTKAEDPAIQAALDKMGVRYSRPGDINSTIAGALSSGLIVARFTGAAEYGPRALGHRSILANPSRAEMKDTLNLRVKHREEFRPFAPACLREKVASLFDIDDDAPFMLLIVDSLAVAKRRCPAVVHADGTARVQTVTAIDNPAFRAVIEAFQSATGLPVVINTSFNVNGETIVDEPADAIESFGFMDIDCLAIGGFWVTKTDNADQFPPIEHAAYLELRRARYRERFPEDLASIDLRKYGPWFYQGST